MNKCAADIQAAMPNDNVVDEKGTVANLMAKLGVSWFTNNKKKLVSASNKGLVFWYFFMSHFGLLHILFCKMQAL